MFASEAKTLNDLWEQFSRTVLKDQSEAQLYAAKVVFYSGALSLDVLHDTYAKRVVDKQITEEKMISILADIDQELKDFVSEVEERNNNNEAL